MLEFLRRPWKERARRSKARVALRTGLVVVLSVVAIATGASDLALMTPPTDPSLKRAMPLLSSYLADKLAGVKTVRPVISKSYNETGKRFESNHASLIYGGSFLTYMLCARNLAVPMVRGENKDGVSTYRSVLLTKRSTPFHGVESVTGRRLTYVSEASSGGIFARQFLGGKAPASVAGTVYVPARSHEIAVRLVQAGRADFAFVKNLVWEALQTEYPRLHVVASDAGGHPDNVVLVDPATNRAFGKRLKAVLLGMDADSDPRARRVLDALGLRRFIPTRYPDDFKHTATLVLDAGLDPVTYRFSR